MKNSDTTQALTLAFATFLIELRHSLLAGDFHAAISLPGSSGYRHVTINIGEFVLHFSFSDSYKSLVHHSSSSSIDLSPFIEEFGYDLFRDLLGNR